jgi:AcrR family transcriptional regulator
VFNVDVINIASIVDSVNIICYIVTRDMAMIKKQYHHGDLRTTLLEVTARIITEEGVEKVTMRALSQQAGVSRAAPYRHFPDKTGLLCAVAADGFKRLQNELRMAASTGSKDSLSRFETMATAYVDFAMRNPSYYRLMFGREELNKFPTPELRANARAAFSVVVEIIAACQQEGSIISEEQISLPNVVWATIHGLSMLIIDGQIQNGDTRHGIHPSLLLEEKLLPLDNAHKLVQLAVKTIIDGVRNQHH